MLSDRIQSFDPHALSALYAAFDLARQVVEAKASNRAVARDKIAVELMELAATGETDVERLASYAVARVRYGSTRSLVTRFPVSGYLH